MLSIGEIKPGTVFILGNHSFNTKKENYVERIKNLRKSFLDF